MVLKDVMNLPLSLLNRRGSRSGSAAATSEAAATGKEDEAAVILVGDSNVTEKHPEEENERGTWSSELDFAMSCIAYAIGLGNVWRFPYLCFKNGGGAFLIPYFLAMFTCGIPLFFLEVSVGQYLGVGGMSVVGQLCPILKGVGYSAVVMVFLENVYYIIIVAWTLFYILNTVYNFGNGLPWSECSKGNGTWAHADCYNPGRGILFNESEAYLKYNYTEKETMNSVEAYWNHYVLSISSGIDVVGGIRWELFAYLFLAWFIVYFVVWKGLHNSGKILWFSAMFPYAILTVLCAKALTLDGAIDGLKFLFTPDWSRLAMSECWIDGGTQIFFSYGVGIGALLALGSYNKFHHNCYRDALVVCCVNTFTSFYSATVIFSILGFMAKEKGVEIAEVVRGGPGLAFLVYPEAVLQLFPSSLWAILFFIMLFTLGIDSQFCGVESFICGMVDNWPEYLRPRRFKFTLIMCIVMFILGIPMITEGGVYLFQLMDFYAASGMSLLWCVFFQTLAICYGFGAKKMYSCIETMVGYKISGYFYYCWMAFAPAFMMFIFVFYIVKYTPIMYGDSYHYPTWGEGLGFLISLSSMIWVPGYAIYYMVKTPGSFMERIRLGITPVITSRPEAKEALEKANLEMLNPTNHVDVEDKKTEDANGQL